MNKAGFDIVYSNNIAENKSLLLLNILGFQGLLTDISSLSIWWFIGAILTYYLLFSIVLYYSNSPNNILVFSFIAVLPLLFLRNEFNLIHSNVFSYYFIFVAGVLSAAAKNVKSLIKISLSYFIFILTLILISYFGVNTSYLADISKRDIVFLLFAFFFTWYRTKFFFESKLKSSVLIEKLADSSYSIYLFHIPLLTMFKLLIYLIIPSGVFNESIYDYSMIFLGIPFTLLSGDFILAYFEKFHKRIVYKL